MANFHEFDIVGSRQRPFHDLLAALPHLVATAGKADLAASSAETLRQIASQIASASLASFLLPFTYGFTNCRTISFTVNPCSFSLRAQWCAAPQLSVPIAQPGSFGRSRNACREA